MHISIAVDQRLATRKLYCLPITQCIAGRTTWLPAGTDGVTSVTAPYTRFHHFIQLNSQPTMFHRYNK